MQTLPGLPSGGSSPVQGSSPDAARAGQSCIQSCCSPSASRGISPSAGLLSLPPANHCLYSIRKERPGNMATEQVRIHVVSLKTHETLLHSSSCTWKQFCGQYPTFFCNFTIRIARITGKFFNFVPHTYLSKVMYLSLHSVCIFVNYKYMKTLL